MLAYHAMVGFGLGFCALLVALLVDAKCSGGRGRSVFHGHPLCGDAHCRCCLKLSKLWFTRYPG